MLVGVLNFLLFLGIAAAEPIIYDTFYGRVMSDAEIQDSIDRNTTFWCTIGVEPCDPKEFRRLDGTCNNLQNPTRGGPHTPFIRMLPSVYDKGNEPRRAKSGAPLPLSRHLRTELLAEGRLSDQTFTQLVTYYLVFMLAETASLQDSVNYVRWLPYCCTERGKTTYMCVPQKIPDDDPVHRFSNIRCLNMTRPFTYQNLGCTVAKNVPPERINSNLPLMDLSELYGAKMSDILAKLRLYKNGLLKYEMLNGMVWPPSFKPKPGEENFCLLNQLPHETRCHDGPDEATNSLLGMNLFFMWFWRNHNRIATELTRINPCWSDDMTFYTARDINIATSLQMYYYELMPALLGRDNLINFDVITTDGDFRDEYDEKKIPQVSLEYLYSWRWAHTIQEGNLKMYDDGGHYLKNMPIVNLTLRTGYLAIDNNINGITQGAFRQPCGKIDQIIDPDLAEIGLSSLQAASDVATNDHAKGRYFGMAPYIDYLKKCTNKEYKTFDDLCQVMDPERVERLRDNYKDLQDVELLAGIWLERPAKGGHIPLTLSCITIDQLKRNLQSDRHWYERSNRPHAFTKWQLKEIRKATLARFLCDVGDGVTQIQPNAFFRYKKGNEICSCDQIPKIDLNAWKDLKCTRSKPV